MPMKIFPFFFCPAKNLTPMFSGHPLFCLDPSSWVKRHCFVSSWSFRSLLAVLARELCQPQSAPFPCCGSTSSWKGHRVIARNLSSSFSWGKARGKVCSKFLLGPKQSHKVILYMDKLVGVFFCKGGIRRTLVWDLFPGLGHHCWHCASEPWCASTAQIPRVFSAVISNPVFPHFPCVLSRACYLGDNFISVWPLRGWTLTCLGWRETHSLFLSSGLLDQTQQPGENQDNFGLREDVGAVW